METNVLLQKISELEKANTQLSETNRRLEVKTDLFDDLLGNINDLIYRYEFLPEKKFTYVSPSATKLTGYSPEEHYNDPDLGLKLVHPDDRHLLENLTFNKNNPAGSIILRWIKKDGSIILTEQSIKYHFDETGNLVALDGVARALTNFRLTERLIAETSENKNILNTMFETLSVLSGNGTFLFANKNTALHFTKHDDPSGLIGKNLSEYLPKPQYENLIKIYNEVLSSGKAIKQEIMISLPSGDKWFLNTLQPIEFGVSKLKAILSISLDITGRKMIEHELLASETKYRELVEITNDWVWSIDSKGIHTYSNPAIYDLLGYEVDEVVGKNVFPLMHPDDEKRTKEMFERCIVQKTGWQNIPIRWLHKDKSERYFESSASPIIDMNGKVSGFSGIDRDITGQKHREIEYKKLIDGMNDTAFVINFDGKIVEVNKAAVDILGYSRDEFLRMRVFDLDPRHNESEISLLIAGVKFGEQQVFETQHQTRDGKIILVEISSSPVFFHGKEAILSVARNITQRKQAEEMLQDIIDKNPMSIQIVDIDGYTLKVNPAHTALFGAVPPPGFSIFDDLQSKSQELKKLITLAKQGEIVHFPDYYYNVHDISTELPDNPVWIHAILFPLKDTTGKFDRVVLMHENITGRKQSEAYLRESEQKYRVLVDNAFEGIVIINLEGNILFANNSIIKTFEYENVAEIIGQNIFNYIAPEYVPQAIEDFAKVVQGNLTEIALICAITSKGKRIWLESIGKIIDYEGAKADMISIRDITAKKEFEEKLRESELKYRLIAENTSDGILIISADTNVRYVSPSYLKQLGYSEQEELDRNSESIYSIIYPEDRDAVFARIFEAIKLKQDELTYSYRIKHKDGHYIWREDSAKFIYDEKGNHIETYIICRDITERKQAIVKLQESEARSRRQREALAKLAVDESLLKTDLKEGFEKITEILAKTVEVEISSIWLFSEDEKTLDCVSLHKSGAKKDPGGLTLVSENIPNYFHAIRTESRIYASDAQNDRRTIELLEKHLIPQGITSMLDAGILIKGKLKGVICLEHTGEKRIWEADEEAFASTIASIVSQALLNSERMKTKELLRESEQKFREVFNSTNEAIFIGEALTGRMIDCNQRAIGMYGFDNKEEILNGTIGDISANSDHYNELMARHHGRVTVEEGTQTFEWLAKKKNGELFWVEVSLKNTTIGGEKRVLAVVRDISQRKLAENELLESEKKFRHYFENSSIGKSITSPDGSIHVNHALCQMLGYSKEELENKKWQEVTHPDDIGLTYQQIDLLRTKKEKNVRFEKRFLHKNGAIIYVEVNSFLQFDKEGGVLNYFSNINNITAQKQALESLRLSEERNRLLSEVTLEGILIHRKGVAKDLNKSLAKIFGYERKELLNRNFIEFVHPDDITIVQEHIVKDYAHPYEVRAQKKDGEIFFIEIESKNFYYHDEEWRVTAIRDVTERKQQQKEYKQLIDAMNDTAFVINFEGKFVQVNKAAVEILGYSMDELLTMSVKDIDTHLVGGEIIGLINNIKTDIKQVFETEHQTKTGKIIPVEISSSLLNYQGKEAILSVARDITRRKQAELEILQAKESAERSEERFRNYIQSSPTSIFLSDKNGKYTFVNNATCKLLGYTSEEMLQLSITDITKASNNQEALKSFEELRKSGETHDVEKQLIRKDGHVIDIVLDGKKLSENENIAFVKDISDRKIAEQKLKDQNEEYAILNQQYVQINYQLTHTNAQLQLAKEIAEENEIKFRLMYENTSIGIAVISLEFKILAANRAYCKMLGFTENELIGKTLQEITHPETVEENIRLQTELLQGLIGSYQIEKWFLHKNGNTIYGLLTATLIKNSKNEPLYFLGNVQDITERKNAETALRESELFASAVAETTPALIYIYDIEKGKNIWSNNIHKQFFAKTKPNSAELLYEDISQVVYPEDFKMLLKLNDEMVNDKNVKRFDTEIRINCEGVWKWMQCIVAVFKTNSEGKAIQTLGVLFDIDDRKKAENDVKESNTRFDLAMMASQDGLFDWNLISGEIYYSPGWKRMLGYEDHELQNDFSIWENFTHPEDVEASWKMQQDVISRKIDRFVMEFRMKHKNGHWVDVLSQASAIFDEDGKAVRFVGTHHDITTRKRAELSLIEAKERAEESETRFKALHNASFGGIAIHDTGIILDCNYGLTQLSGYSQEELIGMDGLLLIHENSRQMVLNNILAEYEKPYEATGIHKNGTEYPLRLQGKMIPYKGKKVRVVEFRDITEQKKAELEIIKAKERAEENEVKFKAAFYTSPDSININKLNGEYVEINEGFTRLSGYLNEDVIGKKSLEIEIWAIPEDRARLVKGLKEHGIVENLETMFRIKDGSLIPALMSAQIIKFNNESFILSVTREISERKKFEQELILAKEKAEESDRLKSAFLANMSHEIRTPMNGILGFAELLKEPELTGEEQHKYIAVIEKSGERMLNIINDIIDISKIEAGQVKVELSDTDINDLSEFLCNFFEPEIKKKGLTFTYNIPKSENHLIVSTDREKLYAILTNLVKNAIKYTPHGNIEFGYEIVATLHATSLRFYVKDTGIGIPKDRQHAIFDRFVQADIEDIKAMEGAGLGLAISKAYAEMLGGTIRVESEQGEGSVFWLNLPLQHSDGISSAGSIKNDLKNEVPHTLKDFTVLIAEDEFTSDLYLTEIMKAEFKEILHADTGTETVEIIRKNQHIKFILMDIKMPLMNGYDATRMIRTFNKDVIIIAQTAYALSGDREKALEAGCNDYISKPVKKDLLFSILRHYLTKNTNE